MTRDQAEYAIGMRSRPMTDGERILDDARRIVDAYRDTAPPEVPGARCARG